MKKHLGLAAKKCVPCEAGKAKVLSDVEVNSLRNQTPGWQIITNAQGHCCLRQQWKVKNFKAGLEVFERIGKVAEEEGHHPDLHLEGYNTVAADLSTHSVGKGPQPSSASMAGHMAAHANLSCVLTAIGSWQSHLYNHHIIIALQLVWYTRLSVLSLQ